MIKTKPYYLMNGVRCYVISDLRADYTNPSVTKAVKGVLSTNNLYDKSKNGALRRPNVVRNVVIASPLHLNTRQLKTYPKIHAAEKKTVAGVRERLPAWAKLPHIVAAKGKLKKRPKKVARKAKKKKVVVRATKYPGERFSRVQEAVLKADIKRICTAYTKKQLAAHPMTKAYIEKTDKWAYREPYYILYREFDRLLTRKLAKTGHSINKLNLGFHQTDSTEAYVNLVAKAGLLSDLHNLAIVLFKS